ncbi:hypothetical protein Tco_0701063 [Tanacetum coccineum]
MMNHQLKPADKRYVILSNGSRHPGKIDKEVVVLQWVDMNQISGILQEVYPRYSGLTQNEISRNLRFTKDHKGEEDACSLSPDNNDLDISVLLRIDLQKTSFRKVLIVFQIDPIDALIFLSC